MRNRLYGTLILLPALCCTLAAQQMSKGFEHFYNLEYNEAIREFQAEVAQQPGNPAAHNHLAQAFLYRELYKAGALETETVGSNNPFLRREPVKMSSEAQQAFESSVGKAMSLAQAAIAKNGKDTAALYALGVAHGLRANYNFLVRKAWMDALRDAGAARKATIR